MVVTPCNVAVVTKIEVGVGCDSRSAAHSDEWRQQEAIHEQMSHQGPGTGAFAVK